MSLIFFLLCKSYKFDFEPRNIIQEKLLYLYIFFFLERQLAFVGKMDCTEHIIFTNRIHKFLVFALFWKKTFESFRILEVFQFSYFWAKLTFDPFFCQWTYYFLSILFFLCPFQAILFYVIYKSCLLKTFPSIFLFVRYLNSSHSQFRQRSRGCSYKCDGRLPSRDDRH